MVALSHQAKKCPDEPGKTGMMESAVHGWVSQGLQHEVIAMASCCKKGGGQKWEQLPPPKLHALPGTAVSRS